MGNQPNSISSSSLIVQHSRDNTHFKNYPIVHNSDKRSQSNNPYRNYNQSQIRNSLIDPKLKIVSSSKAKFEQISEKNQGEKNSVYFSVKGLQNQTQKYKNKEKIKINKTKSSCSTAEKPYIYSSVGFNEKKQVKPQLLIHQNARLFKQASRQPFLSPGGSSSKRKIISVKQTSLNKSPKNIKIEKSSSYTKNQPPLLASDQIQIRKSYDLAQKQQLGKSKLMKATKNQESVHEIYFQKSGSKPQASASRIKTQNQNRSTLYIPIEDHKNPMGKQKLVITEKKQKKIKKALENVNPLENSLGIQSVKQVDSAQNCLEVFQSEMKKVASIQIIKDKQYSICEDSAQNLSKMSIKEIESEIRFESSQVNPGSMNFVFDESIIIRGANQQ